jgi:hypothetical protein
MPKANRANQDNAVLVGLYNFNLKLMFGSIACVVRITPLTEGGRQAGPSTSAGYAADTLSFTSRFFSALKTVSKRGLASAVSAVSANLSGRIRLVEN